MNHVSTIVRAVYPFAAVLAVAALTACDNPVSSSAHVTPAGFTITEGATVLVQGTGGRTSPTVTGQLAVQAGQQRGPLAMAFTDRDGQPLPPPSGYYVLVENTGTAGIATWQPAGSGLGGTLTGVAAGTTTLRISWMHGPVGGGHAETRWNVDVVVSP